MKRQLNAKPMMGSALLRCAAVVACRNEADLLRQHLPMWISEGLELVIIDHSSTDATRAVEEDSTVVGIPGRVIHQSGVRINPLAHSALPDAEANVMRNLMERIDELENTVNALRSCLDDVATDCALQDDRGGEAQSLKDREILEFLGESSG